MNYIYPLIGGVITCSVMAIGLLKNKSWLWIILVSFISCGLASIVNDLIKGG